MSIVPFGPEAPPNAPYRFSNDKDCPYPFPYDADLSGTVQKIQNPTIAGDTLFGAADLFLLDTDAAMHQHLKKLEELLDLGADPYIAVKVRNSSSKRIPMRLNTRTKNLWRPLCTTN